MSNGDLSAALDRETRVLLVREKHGKPRWSDDDIVECLRHAAALHPGKPLTAHRYGKVQEGRRRSDTGPDPAALRHLAGGLRSRRGSRRHVASAPVPRGWTESELLGWVADYLAEPGMRGTYAGYDTWARRTDGAPSAQTVRNRLGAWAAVKRAAAVLVVAREQARPAAPRVSLAA